MREKTEKTIITFHTTAEAMAMEKLCKAASLAGRLIPIPRQISADCGLAWSAPKEDRALLLDHMKQQNLEYDCEGIYFI